MVCAWGNNVSPVDKGQSGSKKVLGILREEGKTPYTLGCPTKQGQPRHPLYVRGDTAAVEWNSLDSSLRSE